MSSPVRDSWSSEYEDWRTRATVYPSPASYVSSRSNLVCIGLRNDPAEPKGFTLALFRDKVAVDAMGRMIILNDKDFNGITALAGKMNNLVKTGSFRNTWRIKHATTSQPIDRILVGSELEETSVYGFVKGLDQLETPVSGIAELPDELGELMGLVLEGRRDIQKGYEDKEMVQKMKDLIGDKL